MDLHKHTGLLNDYSSPNVVPDLSKPTDIIQKAWEIFRSVFKDGDEVVAEDSCGKFHWGKLKCHNEYCTLTRMDGYSIDLEWNILEFMSHDGFPVGRLFKMSPEEAAKRADQTPDEVIRAAFEGDLREGTSSSSSYVGLGCPYLAGPCVLTKIYNRGNSGRRFWYSELEEVLEFRSADGAILLNWDTSHLFLPD